MSEQAADKPIEFKSPVAKPSGHIPSKGPSAFAYLFVLVAVAAISFGAGRKTANEPLYSESELKIDQDGRRYREVQSSANAHFRAREYLSDTDKVIESKFFFKDEPNPYLINEVNSDGKIVRSTEDADRDGKPERRTSYDESGKPQRILLDANEDGEFEEIVELDKQGRPLPKLVKK